MDNLGFSANFRAEFVPLDPEEAEYQFFRPRRSMRKRELVLEIPAPGTRMRCVRVIHCNGCSWTAAIKPGPGGQSGLFATPNPDALCVVCSGQAYWIPALAPRDFAIVESVPVRMVLRVPRKPIMIFVDFTRLTAYGAAGFLWQSADVSWDGIEITSVSEDEVRGRGWDSPGSRYVDFVVQTGDGHHEGGAAPLQPR